MNKTLNTNVIIFFVVVFITVLTFIVPVGRFEVNEQYVWDSQKQELTERLVLNPDSFQLVEQPDGSPDRRSVPLFGAHHGVGLFNYVYEGISSSVSIFVFILVIGGAFGIILKTGAIESAMLKVIDKLKGREIAIIPILFVLFSLGGATFGMGEEAIPMAMIVVPLLIAMGYDAITGVLVSYGATQVGFAASWMNPFSIAIAQGIAGIPVLSGMGFRIIIFFIFTIVGALFTYFYARKIKKSPMSSLSYESDAYFRDDFQASKDSHAIFSVGHAFVLLTVTLGLVWIGVGVLGFNYFIPEIATQFFIIGFIAGLFAVFFKLNDMTVNGMADSFVSGAKDLLGAALVVGMARGILFILSMGGDPSDPTHPNLLNTLLYYVGSGLQNVPRILSAWLMYVFQAVFNFFVPSGSGKAALTMPLMAPLAQYAGISRQVSVLAFQLGDGFTNIVVPTSGALMGVLAVARLDWVRWAKSQIKFQAMLFVLSTAIIIFAVLGGSLLGTAWVEEITIESSRQSLTALTGPGEHAEEVQAVAVPEPDMVLPADAAYHEFALSEGETTYFLLELEEGADYLLFAADSYSNDELGNVISNPITAIWFLLYDAENEVYPSNIYVEPEPASAYQAVGGYTAVGNTASARFTATHNRAVLLVEGSRSSYSGNYALKLEKRE